jgi:predicted RNA-binding protein YlxR (DUF448 family)
MKTRQQGSRPRHRPQRSCVVCRSKQDKRALTRIVSREGSLQIDPGGKAEGRGAYLCGQESCWESAANGTALANALSMEFTDADRLQLLRSKP